MPAFKALPAIVREVSYQSDCDSNSTKRLVPYPKPAGTRSFKIGSARVVDKYSTRLESVYLLSDLSVSRKRKDAKRAYEKLLS